MSFQTPITVKRALEAIESREFVLPAIQRELVWTPEQIVRLFDSLMRGYPIGSLLFWKVRDSIRDYRFYDFMVNYHQRSNRHLQPLGEPLHPGTTAVLDGQQRLTALNIGLRGSYAQKLPYKHFKNPSAYPKRHLYLNVLANAAENEAGMTYDFRFLTDKEVAARHEDKQDRQCWYRCSEVLQARDAVDLGDFLVERNLGNQKAPLRALVRLHSVVHLERVIAYYEEDDQNLDKVLDIFIRTNSGGTALSYSDMLMSMATAQWRERDARDAIHGTVDQINEIRDGFSFSRDFVLRAGLMLSGADSVEFRITNFKADTMKVVEDQWDRITRAVHAAVELVADFGLSGKTLTAHSAVLPIAHYLYGQSNLDGGNRDAIRMWLIKSLLKRGIWGSGLASLLTALRRVIDDHGNGAFPVAEMLKEMERRGKSLTFVEEELEDLVESDDRTFMLLSLLFFHANLGTRKFHVDHIFPRSQFHASRLRKSGFGEDDIQRLKDRMNRLPNLQLLVGETNQSKSDLLPRQWMATLGAEESAAYVKEHLLGDAPADMEEFDAFYDARRKRLLGRLRRLLGPDG